MTSIATSRVTSPMGEMNTTPLIDVLLVLLVMFIITIPPATHTVDYQLPSAPPPVGTIDPVINTVEVTAADTIRWNGTEVSSVQLAALLKRTTRLPVEPELQFKPMPQASYNLSAGVLNLIKRSGATKVGFVGNEQFAEFGKAL